MTVTTTTGGRSTDVGDAGSGMRALLFVRVNGWDGVHPVNGDDEDWHAGNGDAVGGDGADGLMDGWWWRMQMVGV